MEFLKLVKYCFQFVSFVNLTVSLVQLIPRVILYAIEVTFTFINNILEKKMLQLCCLMTKNESVQSFPCLFYPDKRCENTRERG